MRAERRRSAENDSEFFQNGNAKVARSPMPIYTARNFYFGVRCLCLADGGGLEP